MSGASFGLPCGRVVGGDSNCLIIAEIGQNHQGDISIAKQLIDTAKVRPHLQRWMNSRCMVTNQTLTFDGRHVICFASKLNENFAINIVRC